MMTMEQFAEEKARLVALYGGTSQKAAGKRAKAFAMLYARSEWTERDIAEIEKFEHSHVHNLLVFGKFLNYLVAIGHQDIDILERNFRPLWRKTDKTRPDDERYVEVIKKCERQQEEHAHAPSVQVISKQLITQFNDGKYHRISDMAAALNVDMPTIRGICDRIVSQGTFQTFGERRPASPKDGSYAYRFVKGGKKKIDLTVFRSEVQPVIDDMQMIINGPRRSDFSLEAMKTAFAQLLKVLDSIAR